MNTFTADGTETEPVCPLCGHARGRVRYRYDVSAIIECERCGLWRTCPRLSAVELERYYEREYYSEQLAAEGRYEQWRAANRDVWRRNAELVRNEARRRVNLPAERIELLDVGCGQGFFLQECIEMGMKARGIEPSPHAVRYAQEELKLDVRQLTPDQLPQEEKYHVVTLWEVLEHVPDPLATLHRLRAHLHEGGMIWVAVPNANALQRHVHGANYSNFLNKSHLTHFTRRTLRAILQAAGFENVQQYVYWGGGGRRGPGALAQYIARWMSLGTDIRFVAENKSKV